MNKQKNFNKINLKKQKESSVSPQAFDEYKIPKKKKIKKSKNDSPNQSENYFFAKYSKKALQKCKNHQEESYMRKELQKVKNNAIRIGDFVNKNWDLTPLPILPREKINDLSFALNNHRFLSFHSGSFSQPTFQIQNPQPHRNNIIQKPQYTQPSIQNIQSNTDQQDYLPKFYFSNQDQQMQQTNFKSQKKVKNNNQKSRRKDNQKQKNYNELKVSKQKRIQQQQDEKIYKKKKQYNNNQKNQNINSQFATVKISKKQTNKKLIGKCKDLEKKYFRLTEEPDPYQIRPLNILKQSFDYVMNKYKSGKEDHNYLIDQLRSIRQDLLVQDIKNEFTVKVYEINCKFAIDNKDFHHFSKSLNKLVDLYSLGLPGNKNEFYLYQFCLLCIKNRCSEIHGYLKSVPQSFLISKEFQFGIKLQEALQQENYIYIFQLGKQCQYTIVSMLIKYEQEQLFLWALNIMCNSTAQQILIKNLTKLFLFSSEEKLIEFLKKKKFLIANNFFFNFKQNKKQADEINSRRYELLQLIFGYIQFKNLIKIILSYYILYYFK